MVFLYCVQLDLDLIQKHLTFSIFVTRCVFDINRVIFNRNFTRVSTKSNIHTSKERYLKGRRTPSFALLCEKMTFIIVIIVTDVLLYCLCSSSLMTNF